MSAHDLLFFEKRSTPKVVASGESFTAPESYGKQTKRRKATEEEEKVIARGDWLRVDQSGNKPKDDNYKKTEMKGREHLAHEDMAGTAMLGAEFIEHFGVRGMKWGVRRTPEQLAARRTKLAGKQERRSDRASKLQGNLAKKQTAASVASRARDRQVAKVVGRPAYRGVAKLKDKRKVPKLARKANRAQIRAEKAGRKYVRANKRAMRMDGKIRRLDKRVTKLGQQEAKRILAEQRAAAAND